MKALSIHAPYIYEILSGKKKEEYRTWKPRELGRIVLCSSAKRYPGFVSGYALCTVEIKEIKEYPHQGPNGKMLYGWLLKNVQYIEPFFVKGKLHLFDIDDDLVKPLHLSKKEYFQKVYCPLAEPEKKSKK